MSNNHRATEKLQPTDERVVEIANVYRALGIDLSQSGTTANAVRPTPPPGMIIVPMLSNKSSFS